MKTVFYFIFVVVLTTMNSCDAFKSSVSKWADYLREGHIQNYDDALSVLGKPTYYDEGDDIVVVTWDRQKQETLTWQEKQKVKDASTRRDGKFYVTDGTEYQYKTHSQEVTTGVKIIITFWKSSQNVKTWRVCNQC